MPRSEANSPHPVDLHVGQRVAAKRVSLGYTQANLAQAVGLTFQQIQKYEKGINRISASKLWEIARVFGVDIGHFFEGLEATQSAAAPPRFEPGAVLTPQAAEISKLASALSKPRQKLVLAMVRTLAAEGAGEAAETAADAPS